MPHCSDLVQLEAKTSKKLLLCLIEMCRLRVEYRLKIWERDLQIQCFKVRMLMHKLNIGSVKTQRITFRIKSTF